MAARQRQTQGRGDSISFGFNRRDFLRASVAAPAVGAAVFGYHKLSGEPVRAGLVGTGNEGCGAMINQSPPDYLQYVAYHDIRPSQIARGRKVFKKLYGPVQGEKVKFYDTYAAMLADPNIEAIVIATPLWTHAELAIEAMKAGKHVLCEKLMAHNISDAKAMVRTADDTGRILAIGHQRHYSTLYADTLDTIRSGVLGDICYIKAMWHRNNTQINPKTGEIMDSWHPPIPEPDVGMDFGKYGYKSLEELVRWRLYDRTGGGLMAELGSHQLDACSIFLSALAKSGDDGDKHKLLPIAVSGVGGKMYYEDDRDCFDHVYCTYEFPSPDEPGSKDPGVVVTYSSINTNALAGYGEVIEGTRGSLMVLRERDVLLIEENDPLAARRKQAEEKSQGAKTGMKVVEASKDESSMYSAASLGLPVKAEKQSSGDVSRGYTEELEHFAFCIRHPDPVNKVRCDGRVGLADAVMALTANIAMKNGTRIEFKPQWFDVASDEAPEDLLA